VETIPTSLEELYDRYIRALPQEEKLRLLAKIAAELALSGSEEEPPTRSLLELEGLGAEIWQGIDAQQYVHELREEWEPRP